MRFFRKRLPVFCMGGFLLFLIFVFLLSFSELPARESPAPSSVGTEQVRNSAPLDRQTLRKLINGRGLLTRKARPLWLIGIDNMGAFEEKDKVFVSP